MIRTQNRPGVWQGLPRPFFKMNGCGNDFVVFDGRSTNFSPSPELCHAIASRGEGVGCDQILVIEPGDDMNDATMHMYNADGSEPEACGNGARCVALLLGEGQVGKEIVLKTRERRIFCKITGENQVRVDMGAPDWNPETIPLAVPTQDATCLDPMLFAPPMPYYADIAGAVSMGNPHGIFFFNEREKLQSLDLKTVGSALEHHLAFPQRANISFGYIESRNSIELHVWERGAGATRCCGTAACAAHALAVKLGLCDQETQVRLPGGILQLSQRERDGHIFMTGHAALDFEGVLDPMDLLLECAPQTPQQVA